MCAVFVLSRVSSRVPSCAAVCVWIMTSSDLEHHLEEGVDAAAAQLRTQQFGLVALRLLRHPLGQRLLVQSGDGSF